MTKAKMPKMKWTAGRGTLWIIAIMFGISALIRVGAGTGQAIAKEVVALTPAPDHMSATASCAPSPEIEILLADLTGRQEYLNNREQQLADLRQTLAVAEEQIQLKLVELSLAEEKLSATVATTEMAAETDLERLTSVYENMKPKQASTLFEEMAPEFAAGFVGRMRADAAAEIMAGLSPGTAYAISVILAGRNALAPTE